MKTNEHVTTATTKPTRFVNTEKKQVVVRGEWEEERNR